MKGTEFEEPTSGLDRVLHLHLLALRAEHLGDLALVILQAYRNSFLWTSALASAACYLEMSKVTDLTGTPSRSVTDTEAESCSVYLVKGDAREGVKKARLKVGDHAGGIAAQRQYLQQRGVRHKVEARELSPLRLQIGCQALLAHLQLLQQRGQEAPQQV